MAKASALDIVKYFTYAVDEGTVVVMSHFTDDQRKVLFEQLQQEGLHQLMDDLKLVRVEELFKEYDEVPFDDKSDVLSCACSHCYSKIDVDDADCFGSPAEQEIVRKLMEINRNNGVTNEHLDVLVEKFALGDDFWDTYEGADFMEFDE